MKNIVVLISGNGSNLQAIIDACARKKNQRHPACSLQQQGRRVRP